MSSLASITPAATAVALAAFLAATPAAAITITSTTPTWFNVVGGSGIVLNQTNGAYDDVRWGTGGSKSGLGFDPASPPAVNEPVNTNFLLGTLRHYNNPVDAGSAASSVDLRLQTAITGAVPATETFNYRFLVDETPNQLPCAYPSVTACADKITFQNLNTTAAFTVGGVAYALALVGFSANGGVSYSTDFISQENQTNTIGLYARFQQATPVPEPASLALLGTALVAAGLIRRRRQALDEK